MSSTARKVKRSANNVANFPTTSHKPQIFLRYIRPKTPAQKDTFDAFKEGYNLMLKGSAGTGKTFIALYLALEAINNEGTPFTKVNIIRSAVPTRDLGALPGDLEEKTAVYEMAYFSIVNELTENRSAYTTMKANGTINFLSTSFLRGMTFRNSIVIVDEAENCNYHELATIITRAGENCRFIFCGDFKQTDFTRRHEKEGFHDFIQVLERMESFDLIDFTSEDIVRGGLVKEFILAEEALGR